MKENEIGLLTGDVIKLPHTSNILITHRDVSYVCGIFDDGTPFESSISDLYETTNDTLVPKFKVNKHLDVQSILDQM